jgi:hypothetical protein
MSNDTQISIDDLSLLDQDITEIAELAGFDVPPNGEYILGLTVELKAVNGKASVVWNYRQIQCVKQDNEEDKPTPVDTKFSTLFMLAGDAEKVELAKRSLRTASAPFAEYYGETNLLQLVKKMVDAGEILIGATVKRRADREDKEKFYANVKNITIQG